jgi:CRISPR-associated protein Csx14
MMNKISVPFDPTNPGQFYACCALIDLFDLSGARVQSRFRVSDHHPRTAEFELRSEQQMDLSLLLSEIRIASFEAINHPEKAVKPIRLSLARGDILLDWWFDPFRIKTVSIKCWAGQVTTERLMAELLPMIDPAADIKVLFQVPRMMKTRFGVDPRSAWNSLDIGYSPNEHNQDTTTYPLVELLAAIGLQGFRPNSQTRSSVMYSVWKNWLPRVPARRAATIGWPGLSCRSYQFSIEKRGQSYKYFTFATPNGE